MAEPIRIAEEGFCTVVIGDVEQTFDLWKVNNHIVDLRNQAGEEVEQYHNSLVEYISELGYPEVSHKTANAFAMRVHQEAGALEKKDNGEAME